MASGAVGGRVAEVVGWGSGLATRVCGRVLLSPFPSQLPDDAHEGFRIHHRYTVRPEGLTFAGRSLAEVRTAVGHLLERVPNPSFAGVLLHDLSGIRALTE